MTELQTLLNSVESNPYPQQYAEGLQAIENLRLRLELADTIIKQVAGGALARNGKHAEIAGGTFEAAVAYLKEYND